MNDGKMRKASFVTEVTLNLEVFYEWTEKFDEIEIESIRATVGHSSKDVYLDLPLEIFNKIEAEIMEAIVYEKTHP